MSSPVPIFAAWWRRAIAQIVDLIIVAALAAAIIAIAGGRPYWHVGHLHGWELGLRYLAVVVAAFVYLPAALVLSRGRTVGKYVFGIAVTREDGGTVGFWPAVWREVIIKIVLVDGLAWLPTIGGAVVSLLIIADVTWPLWSVERVALHDLAARTRVIRANVSH